MVVYQPPPFAARVKPDLKACIPAELPAADPSQAMLRRHETLHAPLRGGEASIWTSGKALIAGCMRSRARSEMRRACREVECLIWQKHHGPAHSVPALLRTACFQSPFGNAPSATLFRVLSDIPDFIARSISRLFRKNYPPKADSFYGLYLVSPDGIEPSTL